MTKRSRHQQSPASELYHQRASFAARCFSHLLLLASIGVASLAMWASQGASARTDVTTSMDESVWQPLPERSSPTEPTDAELGLDTATSTTTPAPTPTRQRSPSQYQVQSGDTISGIAQRFGVSADTILWANGLANPNSLYVGQTLMVLPISGVSHEVKEGENLSTIAATYNATPAEIAEYNGLGSDSVINVGQLLMIPGGRPPTPQPTATPTSLPTATATPTRVPSTPTHVPPTRVPPTAVPQQPAAAAPAAPAPTSPPLPKGNGQLAWPLAGTITQRFGEGGHSGLDIAAPMGTPIRASADGKVVNLQQWSYGYGWFVVIDHGNGMKSLYAHMSAFNVKLGDTVAKGQQIGAVGSTGLSTGPHLHFEVRVNDRLVNPVDYL